MSEKKIDKRRAQGAKTKQKLYEIAEKLFSERSFTQVNVEDITRAAGITKGAFYVHFESKDALIAALIADNTAKADAEYQTFLEALPQDMPTWEVLLSLSRKIADTLSNSIGYENMSKVYQLMLAGAIDAEPVKGYGRLLYTLLRCVLEKGIERGELRTTLAAEALAQHFVMAFRGVGYEWCVGHPHFDLKEQLEQHCLLLLRGICPHMDENG
jgi:AcrR family transcriptional regulator